MAISKEQYTLEATLRVWLAGSGYCPASALMVACENVGIDNPHLDDHEWAEDEGVRIIAERLQAITPEGHEPLDLVNDRNLGKVASVCLELWACEISKHVTESNIENEIEILNKPDLNVSDILQ